MRTMCDGQHGDQRDCDLGRTERAGSVVPARPDLVTMRPKNLPLLALEFRVREISPRVARTRCLIVLG